MSSLYAMVTIVALQETNKTERERVRERDREGEMMIQKSGYSTWHNYFDDSLVIHVT